jgi:site-specific recombinase XerD
MVRSHYPYLIQQRHRWFVRMVVPPEVRDIVGQAIFKVATGETDQHRAATVAAPIIADLQARIRTAREAGRRLEQVTAEQLAERYRAERGADPEQAEITRITDVVAFVLKTQGHRWTDYARHIREADYDAHAALRLLPGGDAAADAADRITGHATPLQAYLERWKPDAGLKPRPLDQAVSSIKQFDKAVARPIEKIADDDVQNWIDHLISPQTETGLSAKTINRKLSELRNYWKWMQHHRLAPKDRHPFSGRRVRDPAHRRKTNEELRQRFRPEHVVLFWTVAEQYDDAPLAAAIRIAAYSGARIEGVAQLRTADIRVDPETGVRFMKMADKTTAGQRDVPVHSKNARLIDRLIKDADSDGYLIHSNAQNKYGERSQPLGKRFGRLKARLGFDRRYVFHSIRHTVAHLLETAECPEGIANDIVGHQKAGMTYGLYSGETRIDHRARWLAKAVRYPVIIDDRHPERDGTASPPPAPGQAESPPSTSARTARGIVRTRRS